MISTATMIGVGKVYGNLMVDVKATNLKLVERCHRIVMEATGCTHEEAGAALAQCDNSCKIAIVMILLGVTKEEAVAKLNENKQFVRAAVGK